MATLRYPPPDKHYLPNENRWVEEREYKFLLKIKGTPLEPLTLQKIYDSVEPCDRDIALDVYYRRAGIDRNEVEKRIKDPLYGRNWYKLWSAFSVFVLQHKVGFELLFCILAMFLFLDPLLTFLSLAFFSLTIFTILAFLGTGSSMVGLIQQSEEIAAMDKIIDENIARRKDEEEKQKREAAARIQRLQEGSRQMLENLQETEEEVKKQIMLSE